MMITPHDTSNALWRKSSRSGGGNCVEVAGARAAVAIRDSKAPGNGHLTLSARTWLTFTAQVRAGCHERSADEGV
ncbi:DUF397 domain-containing protein [Actinomadura sp. KC345]|uniref:DUF397 domain-containing protein n=1 Tax=Actinomadura sp. KC345 TaxID=2530371 RepID=UPI001043020F|nr:DUF397 domain-containing protein [Actinomadura sp. KC345]TDC56256.1 DUF397 domain-containing protein [Actinomadura sp. KC345]